MREEEYFYPEQLANVARVIAKSTTKSIKIKFNNINNDYTTLVKKICNLKTEDVERFAYTLTDSEITYLALFLANNMESEKHWINDDNIYIAFDYVLDSSICDVMFHGWQNCYYNTKFNTYLASLCQDDLYKGTLDNCHMSSSEMAEIIMDDLPPIKMGEFCIDHKSIVPSKKIEDLLEYYGILRESKLFIECVSCFYTYCDKESYLSIQDEELAKVIKDYSNEMYKSFLKNILSKLTIRQLSEKFNTVALVINNKVGEIGSDKYENFLHNLDDNLKEKYNNWINSAKILQIFGDNIRSRFWKQFKFKNVKKYRNTASTELRFENHVIVEFIGDDSEGLYKDDFGPMYIYDAETFDKKIRYQMINNNKLRSFLYNNQQLCLTRLQHQGYWQSTFEGEIRFRGITTKILD